ncbi:hypothetical protein HELRODRAFT_172621 [Helobdella robusta]|uniref:carbonic anhydrase n=1 Tax=Helobdella robusta TaxID=6412 RepID=T1F5N2_HELRO|nr:hypothetical protein HELRODRAFT_172621 [Helobdella robusta]ESO04263.1 hypothetical protein HELRODRAFT_172621 [Helobdella robusta]
MQSPIDITDYEKVDVSAVESWSVKEGITTVPMRAFIAYDRLNFYSMYNPNDHVNVHEYGKYFNKIEFKWPSEHTLDGKSYPFQMSIIYVNAVFSDRISVDKSIINVIFAEVGNRAHHEVQKFVDELPKISPYRSSDDLRELNMTLTLSDLFPENKSFFQYKGSGTTRSCPENVDTRVYKHPIYISQEQLDSFKRLKKSDGTLMETSRNELKEPNGRKIVYVEI